MLVLVKKRQHSFWPVFFILIIFFKYMTPHIYFIYLKTQMSKLCRAVKWLFERYFNFNDELTNT